MTKHGNEITFVFSCCGKVREFHTRAGRDKIADIHMDEYLEREKDAKKPL